MVETMFTHPRILADTGAANATPAETGTDAILVSDGIITAVGGRHELRERAPHASEVPLPGRAVVAGFHDAHIHLGSVARSLSALDLRDCASLAEALGRVREYLVAHPGAGWVVGGRYDSNRWSSGVPTRHDLDAVCADRPIALASLDGHSAWLNTAGLRAAGIDRNTPDPVGGDIAREADGREPAGVVRESISDEVRELSERGMDPELPRLLRAAQDIVLAQGITHVTDLDEGATRRALSGLRDSGALKIRVHKGIPMSDLDVAIEAGWRTGDGDRWLTVGPVKLFSDGALGSHSAHMGEDFADAPGNVGIEVLRCEELAALVGRANRAGIAVATHAIGDRANRLVLDAYAEHVELTRAMGLRNRVEHAQHIALEDLPRFRALGVVASLQATHCTTDYALAAQRIGQRRLANYAWRSLLDSGAALAFGSDAPIEPTPPMFGVHAAVTRQDRTGEPLGGFEPHERLSVREALSAYSAGAAYAAGLEHRVGRIAPGQYADFVALTDDPTAIDPTALASVTSAATVIDGDVAFVRE
ncbi:amidohydrolase [Leucobacter chromiireducens]|uniref:Amidohydrolase n=1 Tax=Leucobacter chromiireducens subsp. chromiireducens TaxID=660067 RepID=A0ABS1SNM3_9MICO|nr:amidohydrolase [Leucobacter chromiireducens]MBL3689756.1 amidohydrolase [Leucobacter chromiireducens subsp. chromiireducens]